MAVDISRKIGDTLMISGSLDGTNIPDAGEWTGATAAVNIKAAEKIRASDGTVLYVEGQIVIDHENCNLDPVTRAFTYNGPGPSGVGKYYWEVEVTFANSNKLSWPNYEHAILRMKDEVA